MIFRKISKKDEREASVSVISEVESIEIESIRYILPTVCSQDLKIIQLADNIRKIGLIHPISVLYIGGEYCLLSGNRRVSAYKLLGRTHIPANVFTDTLKADDILVVENCFSANSSILVLSGIVEYLLNIRHLSPQEVASKLEISLSDIKKLLNVAGLGFEEKRKLSALGITDSKIFEVSEISNPLMRAEVIDKLYKRRLNTKDLINSLRLEHNKPKFCATNLLDNSFIRIIEQIKRLGKRAELEKSESDSDLIYTVSIAKGE